MRPRRHPLPLLALAAIILLAACGDPAPPEAEPTTEAARPFVAQRVGTPIPFDPTAPLTEVQVRSWSDRLVAFDSSQLGDFFEVARGTRDERFTIPLIDAMRFYEPEARLFFTDTLRLITGVDFPGDDTWPEWYQWLADHPEVSHILGYETWKADLYRAAAGGSPFERFLIEGRDTTLRIELIQFSGAAIEGFPTLDPPPLIAAEAATYLEPDELVVGVAIDGDARAYPLRIVDWHETVNDTVGGIPLTVAHSTFGGSSAVWDRRTEDGAAPLTFGYSGLIYEATRLLHDNETDNLWDPLTGRPVHGPRAGDPTLRQLPAIQTTWSAWRDAHPDTLVLDIDTGYVREYTFDTRPAAYRSSPEVDLPYSRASDRLPEKAPVYSLAVDSTRIAYPLSALRLGDVVNDAIEGQPIVLVADGPAGGVRAYVRGPLRLERSEDGALLDETGDRWQLAEHALTASDGSVYPRLVGVQAFWFAHHLAFPDAELRLAPSP